MLLLLKNVNLKKDKNFIKPEFLKKVKIQIRIYKERSMIAKKNNCKTVVAVTVNEFIIEIYKDKS
jgi:hypothetical protein